jgi:hypothetical protein
LQDYAKAVELRDTVVPGFLRKIPRIPLKDPLQRDYYAQMASAER